MPARRTVEASLEAKDGKVASFLPGNEMRTLEVVVPEARRLHEEDGLTVPEISAKLLVSYDVLNQVFLQSYKMAINTVELFERQEKKRLEGEEE
jgi:hypothetical protein